MNRDVLHLLAESRPAHLDPTAPVPVRTRQAELGMALAGARQARRRGLRAVRPVWAAGGLAGVAAATAIALAVSGTTPRAPDTRTASPGRSGEVRLTASQVFLAAAGSSARSKAGSGAYWATETESAIYFQVGTAKKYVVADREQGWNSTARSPKSTSWFVSKSLGAHPATPADEAAWKADGSPSTWQAEFKVPARPGSKPGAAKKLQLTTASKPSFGNPSNLGPYVFDLVGKNVTVKEVMALPSTEKALRDRLLQGYHGHDTESDLPMARDPWLFRVTADLLANMPVSPATRAAAYQILAHINGTRALGRITDPLGRSGEAVAFAESDATGLERQIVVDTGTGLLLSDQEAVHRQALNYPWAKPGTVVSYNAVVKAGWTDAAPVKPEHTYPTRG